PLARAVRRLKEQAQAAGIDALTGLAGRALFERDLAHALAGCSRRRAAGEAAPLAAVFVDLDGFKGVNDTHGHAAGDAALRAVAGVLEGRLRESDRAYRLGGDEFLLLLAETDAAGAAHLAEEVRDAIRELAVAVDGGATVRLTASLGVADTESAGLAVVACADAALYRAKREGGDRIVTYRDDAFVEPLPPGLPDSFLGPLRQRLDRGEPITVAALHPGEGEMAELRRQAQALFPGAVAAECDGDLLLLVEGVDAEEAAARLAEGIHGVSAAAGATDLSEIPAEDAASPAARIAALVNTPLALAREAA
ncbi:MAG: GGDEF domain-containing protein, partial [Nitrospirae bacterium]